MTTYRIFRTDVAPYQLVKTVDADDIDTATDIFIDECISDTDIVRLDCFDDYNRVGIEIERADAPTYQICAPDYEPLTDDDFE